MAIQDETNEMYIRTTHKIQRDARSGFRLGTVSSNTGGLNRFDAAATSLFPDLDSHKGQDNVSKETHRLGVS